MNYRNQELLDRLAAEYVLGTLPERARKRFERVLHTEPLAQAAVSEWEQRLNQMAEFSVPVEPPATAWQQIEQRLFPAPAKPRWYERLELWRGLAVVSSLFAVVFATLIVLTPVTRDTTDYVGVLASVSTQEPAWAARTDQRMRQLVVKNTRPITMPANRGCILWLETPDGERHAVGQLDDDGGERVFALDATLRERLLDSRLIVTVEDISAGVPLAPEGREYYNGKMVPLRSA